MLLLLGFLCKVNPIKFLAQKVTKNLSLRAGDKIFFEILIEILCQVLLKNFRINETNRKNPERHSTHFNLLQVWEPAQVSKCNEKVQVFLPAQPL